MADESNGLLAEIEAQIARGHERFCVGVHTHDDRQVEEEWVDWRDIAARLAARVRALEGKVGYEQLVNQKMCDTQFMMAEEHNRELAALRADKERLREVAELMRQQISCEHLHHNKRDRHDHTQPCPVIARIDAALAPLAAGEAEGA